MARIELRGLTRSFGAVEVLRGIDLTVEDGEFVALVGPSGCGKSTLLRILAGLDDATSGEVLMDGEDVRDLTPKERNIAMVFQSYALYPHMTVGENIGFNLRIGRVPKAERATKVAEVAGLLGLSDQIDRKPSELSGGQRQRVAMGRALVRDPDAFLFDEPLSNLDAKLRTEMRAEIKCLHGLARTTSVYVTHDQIEAMTLADRIVVLKGGVVQQVGTPAELYAHPANAFVAGFIGSPSMNFVDGTLATEDGRPVLDLPGGARIALPPRDDLPPAGPVHVGLRPEHLSLAPPDAALLSGTLEMSEPAGAQNHLKVATPAGALVALDTTLAPLVPGDPIGLTIPAERVAVFAWG